MVRKRGLHTLRSLTCHWLSNLATSFFTKCEANHLPHFMRHITIPYSCHNLLTYTLPSCPILALLLANGKIQFIQQVEAQ